MSVVDGWPPIDRRDVFLLAGATATGLGAVGLLAPGILSTGADRVLLVLLGLAAIVQAVRSVLGHRRMRLDEVDLGTPEQGVRTAAPGDDLDAVLGGFLGGGRIYFHRSRVRSALRKAAVDVLTTDAGYATADARAAIDDGSWTTDPSAAAFLGDADVPEPPFARRLRDRLDRRSQTRIELERAVDALAAVAGLPAADSQAPARSDNPTGGTASIPGSRGPYRTGHWRGVGVVALAGIGVGILAQRPEILLVAVVGVAVAAYARSGGFPPGTVAIRRSLETDSPEPGESIAVTVDVTNDSGRYLPDVRVIDGVPPALSVDGGSPRHGTALQPGETISFGYTMPAERGKHAFGPTRVVARDLPGATERVRACLEETRLACRPRLRPMDIPVPLRGATSPTVGPVTTDRGGTGVEFHATREYRPGDAPARIDWHRRARTGELTTREFREERSATVVLVIDARPGAYAAPDAGTPHGVNRAIDAAGTLAATLLESGNRVGVTAVSDEPCWLDPDGGSDHRARLRELLATHDALSPVPAEAAVDVDAWVRTCRKRLPDRAQVVLLTPLVDDAGHRLATTFEAHGRPVTVVSPDQTARRTPGHRLAAIARRHRLTALRRSGIPALDWSADASLAATCARHAEVWSP